MVYARGSVASELLPADPRVSSATVPNLDSLGDVYGRFPVLPGLASACAGSWSVVVIGDLFIWLDSFTRITQS
jgi:hypothetical protein